MCTLCNFCETSKQLETNGVKKTPVPCLLLNFTTSNIDRMMKKSYSEMFTMLKHNLTRQWKSSFEDKQFHVKVSTSQVSHHQLWLSIARQVGQGHTAETKRGDSPGKSHNSILKWYSIAFLGFFIALFKCCVSRRRKYIVTVKELRNAAK